MKTQKMKIIGMTLVTNLVITVIISSLVSVILINYYKETPVASNEDTFGQDCPSITQEELEAGWYYGMLDQKKPGTPDTWIHQGEGTRGDMWINPYHHSFSN